MNGSETTDKATAQHLDAVADRLALPKGWTAEDLSAALAREWGTVVWLPLPDGLPPDVCGLHFIGPHGRVVFHQRPASPARYRWLLAHAAAHMVLDHCVVLARPAAGSMLTELGSGDGVTADSSPDHAAFAHAEQEANMLADLLLARSARGRRHASGSRCPHAETNP